MEGKKFGDGYQQKEDGRHAGILSIPILKEDNRQETQSLFLA